MQLEPLHPIQMGDLVDVGCRIGSFNFVARELGCSGVGYDLDVISCAYGRNEIGLDLRSELWSEATSADSQLLTCIMVSEHIHNQRRMLREMIQAVINRKAAVYISIPFFQRKRRVPCSQITWNLAASLSILTYTKLTTLPKRGLEKACRQFGAITVEEVSISKRWQALLIR